MELGLREEFSRVEEQVSLCTCFDYSINGGRYIIYSDAYKDMY